MLRRGALKAAPIDSVAAWLTSAHVYDGVRDVVLGADGEAQPHAVLARVATPGPAHRGDAIRLSRGPFWDTASGPRAGAHSSWRYRLGGPPTVEALRAARLVGRQHRAVTGRRCHGTSKVQARISCAFTVGGATLTKRTIVPFTEAMPRLTNARRERNRSHIVESAVRCVASRGVDGTSIQVP